MAIPQKPESHPSDAVRVLVDLRPRKSILRRSPPLEFARGQVLRELEHVDAFAKRCGLSLEQAFYALVFCPTFVPIIQGIDGNLYVVGPFDEQYVLAEVAQWQVAFAECQQDAFRSWISLTAFAAKYRLTLSDLVLLSEADHLPYPSAIKVSGIWMERSEVEIWEKWVYPIEKPIIEARRRLQTDRPPNTIPNKPKVQPC